MLGCGSNRAKRIVPPGRPSTWEDLKTVDLVASHNPTVVHDLNVVPWPFEEDQFSEVHAYEILEHLGRQGDSKSFFETFGEVWRVLEPGGLLCATVPNWRGPWAWGDPGHTRVIQRESLVFLNRPSYGQIGYSPMTDYRDIWPGDLELVGEDSDDIGYRFILKAHKPVRTQ